jgi:hypothetical protein
MLMCIDRFNMREEFRLQAPVGAFEEVENEDDEDDEEEALEEDKVFGLISDDEETSDYDDDFVTAASASDFDHLRNVHRTPIRDTRPRNSNSDYEDDDYHDLPLNPQQNQPQPRPVGLRPLRAQRREETLNKRVKAKGVTRMGGGKGKQAVR